MKLSEVKIGKFFRWSRTKGPIMQALGKLSKTTHYSFLGSGSIHPIKPMKDKSVIVVKGPIILVKGKPYI